MDLGFGSRGAKLTRYRKVATRLEDYVAEAVDHAGQMNDVLKLPGRWAMTYVPKPIEDFASTYARACRQLLGLEQAV